MLSSYQKQIVYLLLLHGLLWNFNCHQWMRPNDLLMWTWWTWWNNTKCWTDITILPMMYCSSPGFSSHADSGLNSFFSLILVTEPKGRSIRFRSILCHGSGSSLPVLHDNWSCESKWQIITKWWEVFWYGHFLHICFLIFNLWTIIYFEVMSVLFFFFFFQTNNIVPHSNVFCCHVWTERTGTKKNSSGKE